MLMAAFGEDREYGYCVSRVNELKRTKLMKIMKFEEKEKKSDYKLV